MADTGVTGRAPGPVTPLPGAPDTARVAPELIHLNEAKHVGLGRLEKAAELEKAGFPALAHPQLAARFNDPEMLPGPEPTSLLLLGHRRRASGSAMAATGSAVVAAPDGPKVRSWAS
jgi:hypothetical protein